MSLPCAAPWYELNVMHNRRVGCCCYYNGYALAWDHQRPRDLFHYWNGPLIQQIRREQTGAVEASGCKDCDYYRFKKEMPTYEPRFLTIPDDATPEQRENWQAALDSWREGRIQASHVPLRFYFSFGVSCNLDCIMCCQIQERQDNPATLDPDVVWAWREHFPKAERLSIIGGEPLAMPGSLEFIRRVVADEGLDGVLLDLYTNGIVLGKHLDMLEAKRKVSVCVSLDGFGDAYEKIRRNGQWKSVEAGLLAYKERAAKHGLPWKISTANIIMKTSLKTLVQLVEWHIRNDIGPNFADFSLVRGIEKTFLEENIYEFPHLLAEVPDWAEQFDQSIRLLEQKGWLHPATTLRQMKADLLHRLFTMSYDIEKQRRSSADQG